MSKHNPYIIRRTLSQERFEVLWKKRKDGQATLKDLTEMDEIINRDAGVRQFVLEEMEGNEYTAFNDNDAGSQGKLQQTKAEQYARVMDKVKAFFNRIFNTFHATKLLTEGNCYPKL